MIKISCKRLKMMSNAFQRCFGISRQEGVCLTEVIGSPEYWALEVAECEYSYPADVWAAGVVLWFAQTKPLGAKNLLRIISFPMSFHQAIQAISIFIYLKLFSLCSLFFSFLFSFLFFEGSCLSTASSMRSPG